MKFEELPVDVQKRIRSAEEMVEWEKTAQQMNDYEAHIRFGILRHECPDVLMYRHHYLNAGIWVSSINLNHFLYLSYDGQLKSIINIATKSNFEHWYNQFISERTREKVFNLMNHLASL